MLRNDDGIPTRVPDDWYVGFHAGLAARFWRAAGAAMADADEQVLQRVLGGTPGALLDVPCGDGRLALRLARAGWRVTGIDLAPAEVELARDRARAEALDATFLVGDLRELPHVGGFDVVLSWGNGFGYLTPAETTTSLRGLRDALRPGGRLVLETLTAAESLLVGGIEAAAAHEFGGIRMEVTNRYRAEESRLESDLRFEADGVVEHARVAHRVHTTGELVRLLLGAGFAEVDLRGPDGIAPFALGDPRLIAVARA
ncbi:MAG: class I SAM-dependent methyltransferase [Thermoleophilia bacterium]